MEEKYGLPSELPPAVIPSQIGKGWYNLVINLHNQLDALVPGYQLDQVKEKFGGLRYYTSFTEVVDDEKSRQFYNLVEEAEAKSFATCEVCGAAGTQTNLDGWVRTLCSLHAKN